MIHDTIRTLGTIFFMLFVILAGSAIAAALMSGIPGTTDTTLEERTLIFSLHDRSQTQGTFVLGSGTLREGLCYTVYADAGNGGIKLQTVPADRTTIFEDAAEAPYLRTLTIWRVNSETGELVYAIRSQPNPTYEIHVPPGTVVQEFTLDGA